MHYTVVFVVFLRALLVKYSGLRQKWPKTEFFTAQLLKRAQRTVGTKTEWYQKCSVIFSVMEDNIINKTLPQAIIKMRGGENGGDALYNSHAQ